MSNELTRDEVIELVRQAHTLEEIAAAKAAVNTWMTAHPQDYDVAWEAETLWMLESAIRGSQAKS